MYQYFFEGDTVRLAYWRIDYDDNRTVYANTEESKLEIVSTLTEQGFTPTVTPIDQTGNEWIDGMCFADHDAVEAALEVGNKRFICPGDSVDIANTLTAMNDALFSVSENGVWNITVPGVPSIPCYGIMTCITANSVDNQKISINGSAPLPLMKAVGSPILANEIRASAQAPLALQINVTEHAAYINASVGDGWSIGEIKSFGYKRPATSSELLCDGSAYDGDRYPLLQSTVRDTYGFPPDPILRQAYDTYGSVAYGAGKFVRAYPFGFSTDGINWTDLGLPGTNKTPVAIAYGNGIFAALVVDTTYNSTSNVHVATSADGLVWTVKNYNFSLYSTGVGACLLRYSVDKNTWYAIINGKIAYNGNSGSVIRYSTDNWETFNSASTGKAIDGALDSYVRAFCPVSDGWIAVHRDLSVYFKSSLSASPEYVYTIPATYNGVSPFAHTYPYTIVDTIQLGGKCMLPMRDTLWLLDRYQAAKDSRKLNCIGTLEYGSRMTYLEDKGSHILVTDAGLCALEPTGGLKIFVDYSVESPGEGISAAAYGNGIIMFSTKTGLYSLDATKFALPDFSAENTYKYIKAE